VVLMVVALPKIEMSSNLNKAWIQFIEYPHRYL